MVFVLPPPPTFHITFFPTWTVKVILDNVHSMQKTLEDMESCRGDLRLPQETKETLVVFSGIKALLQVLTDLEHLTQQRAVVLEVKSTDAAWKPNTVLDCGI